MNVCRSFILGAAAAAFAAGCASAPRSIPVAGDVNLLAGVWQGDFASSETGRRGTIHFELKAGQDSAYGDVLMIPDTWERGNRPPTEYPAPPVETPELIGVRFVRVSANEVRGILTPYYDPACDCTVRTTFTGVLREDRIEGTFLTYFSQSRNASVGKWRAKRTSAQLDPCIDGDNAVLER